MSKIEGCPADYVLALRAGALDREAVRVSVISPSRVSSVKRAAG